MLAEYDVWYRDPKAVLETQLKNPDFKDEIDYAPFQKFDTNGEWEWKDFMLANWSYQQAVHTIFHLS
jgi:Plavaka transposase